MLVTGLMLDATAERPQPGWFIVDDGRIVEAGDGDPPARADLGGRDALITPGFVDAHAHLPQWHSRGCDGADLLSWLDRVIYPAEAAWSDAEVARRGAHDALAGMVAAGTLGAAVFLSSHPHAITAVAQAHARLPIHLLAGPALMDREGPAALLTGTAALPPATTGPGRLAFTVNPRFAISCTEELMHAAAERATSAHLRVHTHLAEQLGECARVHELFPDAPNYAAVYDACGLLRPGTLVAHAIHLQDAEWQLLAQRECIAVHCPTANTFLRSGTFSLAAAARHGVTVALGSDIAAGTEPAMPRVARAMIDVAKLRHSNGDESAVIPSARTAWHMVTRGNADALGLSGAGRLDVGADADFLVLDPPFEIDEFTYGRLIHTWDDSFIAARVIAGSIIDLAC